MSTSQAATAVRLIDRTEWAIRSGICVRTISRLLASGRMPKPDVVIGNRPRWKESTYLKWVEKGGKK